MSCATFRVSLNAPAPELRIIEVEANTATVPIAAIALGVEPGVIDKTLGVRLGTTIALIGTRGNARLVNGKTKLEFGKRPRKLGPEATLAATGHAVGGVCPFGLATELPVYCDVFLNAFQIVYPAAGSLNASGAVAPQRLSDLVPSRWIDVCRVPN